MKKTFLYLSLLSLIVSGCGSPQNVATSDASAIEMDAESAMETPASDLMAAEDAAEVIDYNTTNPSDYAADAMVGPEGTASSAPSTPQPSTSAPSSSSDSGEGMSTGAKVGIAVAAAAVLCLFFCSSSSSDSDSSQASGGGTDYDDSSSRQYDYRPARREETPPAEKPAERSYGLYGDCPQPGAGYGC